MCVIIAGIRGPQGDTGATGATGPSNIAYSVPTPPPCRGPKGDVYASSLIKANLPVARKTSIVYRRHDSSNHGLSRL